jgi:predicted outer membrane repeat protein
MAGINGLPRIHVYRRLFRRRTRTGQHMSARNTKSTPGRRLGLLVTLTAMTIAGCGGGGSSGGGVGSDGAPGTPAPSPAPSPAPAAPTISAQPAAATVSDGAIAQFTITATGDAPLVYQWRRNGVDLVDGATVTGTTTATLNLTASYTYDTSQMSVRVANVSGNVVSGNALLTVTPVAPTIAAQPANTTANVGYPAMLSPIISGGTAPVTYQWKRDGKVIAGATSATYTIGNPDFRDNAASFVLDITNPAGTISSQAAILMVLPPGRSTVFTVDATDDLVDVDLTDGKCVTSAKNCSLRAAVQQANASTDSVTVVNVPAGTYMLTREPITTRDGSEGNLNLSAPSTPPGTTYIIGVGAARTVIDANQVDNVLDVSGGRVATLAGLTLRNGLARSSLFGGIISNIGSSLTVLDCIIENARAIGDGGGIYNTGTLHVLRSTIRSNSSSSLGGGLYSVGIARVYDSTISGNQAYIGGGIFNGKTTYLVNTTISSNTADHDGGGISTTDGSVANPVLTAIYSTSIIGNDADHDRDEIGGTGGGVFAGTGGRFVATNSLLARNTVLDSPQYNDCVGKLELSGSLLIGEPGSCTFSGNRNWKQTPIETVDPILKDNGGPTLTHAIFDLPGSAHESGFSVCVDDTDTPLTTDQRGASRAEGCDIGAFQFGAGPP